MGAEERHKAERLIYRRQQTAQGLDRQLNAGDRVRLLRDVKGGGAPGCFAYSLDDPELPTDRGLVVIPAGARAVVCLVVGDASAVIVAAGEGWPRFAQVWPPSDLEFVE